MAVRKGLGENMTISPNDAELIIKKIGDRMKSDFEAFHKGRVAGLLEVFKMIHDEGDFILELIQNADDADSENLFIDWMDDWLVIRNDGTPFEEVEGDPKRQNVSAICEFNKTTKLGGKIGFMGVGFKSVFRVSDHVEIYSGPLRFYLDERMCVPEWISTPMGPFESLLPEVSGKGSIFCIKMSSDLGEELDRVRETLKRLSTTALLWLQRLNNIRIDGKTISRRRWRLSNCFILVDGSKSEYYRCFYSDPVRVVGDALRRLVKARKGVSGEWTQTSVERSVGISFIVDKEGRVTKKEGQCYAFLPLTEVKLETSFDIQGDFNVGLGRRTLKSEGDVYNDWLFSQVGKAWRKAFDCYKQCSNPGLALQMYRVAPMGHWGEQSTVANAQERYPFRIIKKSIDDYMKTHDTVLVETTRRTSGRRNHWTKPSMCAIPLQRDSRDLFDHNDLQMLLGREVFWVSMSMPEEGTRYLQEFAEVCSLDSLDFIADWGRFEAIANRKARRRDSCRWFAKLSILLAELYDQVYDNERYASRGLDARQKIVKAFPIMLLDGNVTNKKEGNQIFYLPPRTRKMKGIGADVVLKFIHPGIMAYLREKTDNDRENERRENALDFLSKHILTILDAKGQLETIIKPKLESANPNELGQRYLDSVVMFAFQNKECWESAKNLIPLMAEDGGWYPPNKLVLSSAYGGGFDAKSFFGGIYRGAILSERYLRMLTRFVGGKRRKDRRAKVRDFFQELGVNGKPMMSVKRHPISEEDLIARLGRKPGPTRSTGYQYYGYDLEDSDFSDERIREILARCAENQGAAQDAFARLSAFLNCLVREWHYYSEFTKGYYYRYDPDLTKTGRQSQIKEDAGPSAWVQFLSKPSLAWIPAKLGSKKLHMSPREALLPGTSVTSALPMVYLQGNNSSQFQANLSDFKEFFKSMGWEAVPGIEETIAEMHLMCDRGVTEKRLFMEKYQTLVNQIESVPEPARKAELIVRLDSRQWVFTPHRRERYRTSARVQWESQSELFGWKVGIDKDYPDMEHFFRDIIRISPTRVEDCVLFLQDRLWKKPVLSKRDLEQLYYVYRRLDRSLNDENGGQLADSDFWRSAKSVFRFYCDDNSWHQSKDGLYFMNDTRFLKELRKTGANVILVKLSRSLENHPPSNLFSELNIAPLTSIRLASKPTYNSVTEIDGARIRDELRLTLDSLGPIIKGKDRRLFETLVSNGTLESIASADVVYVKGLQALTPLRTGGAIEKEAELIIHRDNGDTTVFISAALDDSHERTVKLLCKELDVVLGGALGGEFVYLVWGKKRTEAFEDAGIFRGVQLRKPMKREVEFPRELTPVDTLKRQAVREIVAESEPGATSIGSRSTGRTQARRAEKRPKKEVDVTAKVDWSRKAVEARAIELILTDENENREDETFVARDVHEAKPGYDIAVLPYQIDSGSFDERRHEHLVKQFIEVKASKTDSDDFVITEKEWEKANTHGDNYFLYRVVNTMSDTPTAFVIRNPAAQYRDALVEKNVRMVEDWRKKKGLRMTELRFAAQGEA